MYTARMVDAVHGPYRLLLAMVACSALLLSGTEAEAQSVAFPKIKGPRRSATKTLAKSIRAGLKSAGLSLVSRKALKRGARSSGKRSTSPQAAKAAGADFLVVVTVKKAKRKRYVAHAKLYDVSSGKRLKKVKKTYKKRSVRKAGKAIGKALGKRAMSAFEAIAAAPDPDPTPDPDPIAPPPDPKPDKKITKPKEKKGEPVAKIKTKKRRKSSGGENSMLRVWLGGGSQLTSAYTVSVGDTVTGLAYTLSPLILINAGVGVAIPGTGFEADFNASFVPVKYSVDVQPPVDPPEPTGRYLNFGLTAGYAFTLSKWSKGGRASLAPVLAFAYDSLSVEEQGAHTVVLSNNSISGQGGVRVGMRVNNELEFHLDGRFGLILSYSEDPSTTGESGSGIMIVAGGGGRYWITSALGVYLDAGYVYQQIGMTGAGNRTPFEGDPELRDATIYGGQLRAGMGVLLGI